MSTTEEIYRDQVGRATAAALAAIDVERISQRLGVDVLEPRIREMSIDVVAHSANDHGVRISAMVDGGVQLRPVGLHDKVWRLEGHTRQWSTVQAAALLSVRPERLEEVARTVAGQLRAAQVAYDSAWQDQLSSGGLDDLGAQAADDLGINPEQVDVRELGQVVVDHDGDLRQVVQDHRILDVLVDEHQDLGGADTLQAAVLSRMDEVRERAGLDPMSPAEALAILRAQIEAERVAVGLPAQLEADLAETIEISQELSAPSSDARLVDGGDTAAAVAHTAATGAIAARDQAHSSGMLTSSRRPGEARAMVAAAAAVIAASRARAAAAASNVDQAVDAAVSPYWDPRRDYPSTAQRLSGPAQELR